jgi:methyltransferase-like protein/SAM-dependent methyltransferase
MSGILCERNEARPAQVGRTGEPASNSYDAVPYNSHAFPRTHPGHLAAVATLFGMRPAPLDRCRVLELGCAGGGNLIPMALTLPAGRFVGVDLSARQIADGQRLVADLSLDNIELRHLNILDVGRYFEQFDYIVCHGVYSWAPHPVRHKILEVCARNLAPQGVAFVSYNTYPGWHMNGAVRDMLCFHARRFARPDERARQARALLRFLAEAAAPEQNAYSRLLTEGLEVFAKVDNSYLLHEYLEEVNEPVYFHQFVERAAAHGLQYLAEAEVHTMAPWRFPARVAEAVARLSSNFIELEQFLDFVRNRKFRQTLLCHADVVLERHVGPERLTGLHVASALRPASPDLDVRPDRAERFHGPRGHGLTTTDPLLKAALVHLAEHWPQGVPFADLTDTARARLGADAADAGQALGRSLLQLYSANMVELHARPLPFVREIAERPLASPLARRQAAVGPVVTNLRHESGTLSDWQRRVLCLLDGSRDRAALCDRLASSGDALEPCLADLAGKALLSGE